jgi:hypothetical protein
MIIMMKSTPFGLGCHHAHQQNNGVLWAAMVGMYRSILSIAPAQIADAGCATECLIIPRAIG